MGGLDGPRRPAAQQERDRHDAAADAFFARAVTPALLERVRAEGGTPSVLLDAWRRDCARVRALDKDLMTEISRRQSAERYRQALEKRRQERADAKSAQARRDDQLRKGRERARAWTQQNPERAAENRRRWAEEHTERRRQINHDSYQRHRQRRLDENKERNRIDPARRAEYQRRYRDTHREKVTALQQAYLADPTVKARHRDNNKKWRHREKARKQAGLPPRRLHRQSPDQIRAAMAEADAFFTRTWTRADVERMRAEHGPATPPDLLQAFQQDCARARLHYRHAQRQTVRAASISRVPSPDVAARAAEDARMDAIARAINQRLRTTPPHNRTAQPDPAAPHAGPRADPSRGLSR